MKSREQVWIEQTFHSISFICGKYHCYIRFVSVLFSMLKLGEQFIPSFFHTRAFFCIFTRIHFELFDINNNNNNNDGDDDDDKSHNLESILR